MTFCRFYIEKEKLMKATEVFGMTFMTNTIKHLDIKSLKLMDEILLLVEQIEGKKEDDGVKIFWISEERGSFTEYKKGKNHDLCIKTKKDFLDYFPFEKGWM